MVKQAKPAGSKGEPRASQSRTTTSALQLPRQVGADRAAVDAHMSKRALRKETAEKLRKYRRGLTNSTKGITDKKLKARFEHASPSVQENACAAQD